MSVALIKQRFHALDNMRAVMMLLGVVFHAALSYATYTLSSKFGYRDPDNSYFLSGVTMLIHSFRMQAFFMIAGFFGALLFYKRGLRAMLTNRCKRILKPLVISWPILFPLSILGAAFPVLGGLKGVSSTIQQFQSGELLGRYNMSFADLLTQYGFVHLWFLYYLMVFYIATAGLLLLLRQAPKKVLNFARQAFASTLTHPFGVFIFAAITAVAMFYMPKATFITTGFENPSALIPHLPVLLGYYSFFIFGWMLFRSRELLVVFSKRIWLHLPIGFCLVGVYAWLIFNSPFQLLHLLQVGVASTATWLLVFSVTGLFLRYADKPKAQMRYLSDASYWIYLVHFPLTTFLPGLFINVAMHGIFKFLAVSSLAFAISLITYHYLVRFTFLGKALNGKKIKRSDTKITAEMQTA